MKLKQVCIVMNSRAGTYLQEESRELVRSLLEVCGEYQVKAQMIVAKPENINDYILEAQDPEKGYDALFLAGGDGTLTHALPILLKAAIPVGILPLGTMNMIARDLEIPLEPVEALRSLLSGKPQCIDVIKLNDRLFVDRVTLGFYPRVLKEWQNTRGEGWWSRA